MATLYSAVGSQDSLGEATDESSKTAGPDARKRVLQRLYRASLRGFGIGLSLRGGLHAVSGTLLLLRARRVGYRHRCIDTLRWAAALAAFGTIYVATEEGVRSGVGPHRCVRAEPDGCSAARYLWLRCSSQTQQYMLRITASRAQI